MQSPHHIASCDPPGHQPVLFHAHAGRVTGYTVIDRHGHCHLDTASLGVALAAARHVLVQQGEVWIRASDDTCAHIDPQRVATDTPACRWIETIAASMEATP